MRKGQKREFARTLRRNMTDAERHLWFHLRNRSFTGAKFRRQHPLGPYIVDFACIDARLVIELDGGQHAGSAKDAVRTAVLENEGYRVPRFWNNDVLLQTEAVLAVVHAALSPSASTTRPLSRVIPPPRPE